MSFRFWKQKHNNKGVESDEREHWSSVAILLLVLFSLIAVIWIIIYAITR